MNCCDDNGNCTNGVNCATRSATGARKVAPRSCHTPGLCQTREPRCADCSSGPTAAAATTAPLRLAPGVIDDGAPTFDEAIRQRHRKELLGAMFRAAVWMAICIAAGLATGLISGAMP